MTSVMLAAQTSTGEAVTFWVLAPLAVAAAVMILVSRKAVHSALWMALTMMILAVFFLLQGGVFLGVVQVVVYTGAVMMLFLFVLMLVGVDASDSLVETLRGQRVVGLLLGAGLGGLVIAGLSRVTFAESVGIGAAEEAAGGHVEAIGKSLFTQYVFPFEVVSAVLITAALGAMVLTHRERIIARKSQRELAAERFRDGVQQTPLPASGVFARHNAVDTPALLPDGTTAPSSVPEQMRRSGTVRPPGAYELSEDDSDGGDR
ncbi:MAG: NADH-quinone oxidoreductase subunit J [Actinomycetota bacterium]|nr:NADH-quinone oxidoreductase subunit J [Actinomycetota bacterium]MDH4353149.1 NADH-quinone oxidoreductase subunit J [Actinomycetota bacterium]MDH5278524.1 NADH-quinone oxidoreductase subunit J [Actinomycetota bacterium]